MKIKNYLAGREIKSVNRMEFLKFMFVFLFGILFILLIFPSASAINEFDDYKPYIHNPSVGDVPELQVFGTYETGLFV
jgi:hypothetical protein